MGMFGLTTDNNTNSGNATRAKSIAEVAQERKAKAAKLAKAKAAKEKQDQNNEINDYFSSFSSSPFGRFNPMDMMYSSMLYSSNAAQSSSSYGNGVNFNLKSNNSTINRALTEAAHRGGQKYGA